MPKLPKLVQYFQVKKDQSRSRDFSFDSWARIVIDGITLPRTPGSSWDTLSGRTPPCRTDYIQQTHPQRNTNTSNGSNPSLLKRESTNSPITQSPVNGSFSGQRDGPIQNPQSRQNSMGRSMSPQSIGGSNSGSPAQVANIDSTFTSYSTNNNMHGFADTLPQMNGATNDPFGDLFSPSVLRSASMDSNGNYFGNNSTQVNGAATVNGTNDANGGESTAGLNRVFQFNSNSSTSDSASPSASSASQWNGKWLARVSW